MSTQAAGQARAKWALKAKAGVHGESRWTRFKIVDADLEFDLEVVSP